MGRSPDHSMDQLPLYPSPFNLSPFTLFPVSPFFALLPFLPFFFFLFLLYSCPTFSLFSPFPLSPCFHPIAPWLPPRPPRCGRLPLRGDCSPWPLRRRRTSNCRGTLRSGAPPTPGLAKSRGLGLGTRGSELGIWGWGFGTRELTIDDCRLTIARGRERGLPARRSGFAFRDWGFVVLQS